MNHAKLNYGSMEEIADGLQDDWEMSASELGALLINMCGRIHQLEQQVVEQRNRIDDFTRDIDARAAEHAEMQRTSGVL